MLEFALPMFALHPLSYLVSYCWIACTHHCSTLVYQTQLLEVIPLAIWFANCRTKWFAAGLLEYCPYALKGGTTSSSGSPLSWESLGPFWNYYSSCGSYIDSCNFVWKKQESYPWILENRITNSTLISTFRSLLYRRKELKFSTFSVGNYPNKTQEPKVEWLKFSTIPNLPQEVPEMRETKPKNFRY